jgi:hypothetical protein
MHATVEVLLEMVFITQSVRRAYREDNWDTNGHEVA